MARLVPDVSDPATIVPTVDVWKSVMLYRAHAATAPACPADTVNFHASHVTASAHATGQPYTHSKVGVTDTSPPNSRPGKPLPNLVRPNANGTDTGPPPTVTSVTTPEASARTFGIRRG